VNIEMTTPSTGNRQRPTANQWWWRNVGNLGRWALQVGCGMFLCLAVGPGGGFIPELSAGEPAATQTPVPKLRAFTESDLLTLLTATLQRDYVKDRGELELICKQPWPEPRLPDAPLTVKILELPTAGVTPSFIVRFQLCTAQESLGTWQTTMQARVWRTVWVAHSNLRRGEWINNADILHERYDVLNVRDALAEFSAADPNLELAAPVAAGAPLLARAVKPRTVIHRGQIANALVQDGRLSISTKVEALEDGAPGEIIRARNPVSSRNLSGKVLDDQTILISL
jgi:flagella basal body P-ring formation protein FlgA